MRRRTVATIALTAVVAGAPASAAPPERDRLEADWSGLYPKAVKKVGAEVVGRDVVKYGMTNEREATDAEIRAGNQRMRRWLDPPRLRPVESSEGPPSTEPSAAPNGHLAGIAECESGGNPSAVSPGGAYRGKYQFSPATWASVGGSGDPAAASEAEQDKRAAILYARSGPGQWPTCSR